MADSSNKIIVSVPSQTLQLMSADGAVLFETSIATAKNGIGQQLGSECTPIGKHYIRAKIGAGQPANAVFVGRRPTGELFNEQLRQTHPRRDWILTRILWLCGTEAGKNRLGNVDTMRRYIYIHGAPNGDEMGIPSSHGCVKMRNQDIIQLFDRVAAGTPVNILG